MQWTFPLARPACLPLLQTGFAKRLTLVSLAGRGSGLCINDSVASLGNTALITERCTELQVRNCTLNSCYRILPHERYTMALLEE